MPISNKRSEYRRRLQKRQMKHTKFFWKRRCTNLIFSVILIATLLFYIHNPPSYDLSVDDRDLQHIDDSRKKWADEGIPLSDINTNEIQKLNTSNGKLYTSSIDTVIRYLNKLADMSPTEAWHYFGMEDKTYGNDPFSLKELESGICPTTQIDWLPARPYNSNEIATKYKQMMQTHRKGGRRRSQAEQYNVEDEVVIWYEHLSKAGGTTFCGLVNSNMLHWQVPRYHCMPKRDDRVDGRVGTWTNEYLVEYLRDERYNIVASEWDSFSIDKLQLSRRELDGGIPKENLEPIGPSLLFLTTLRDPCDRLLSAYTFFAVTTTEGKREAKNKSPPTFHKWIASNMDRAASYVVGDLDSRKGLRSNTARSNHIVWRFSGGALTNKVPLKQSDWKASFETAIRVLSQHDLVLPMDLMTQDDLGKRALQELLGWSKFEVGGRIRRKNTEDAKNGHVVTMGGIKNSNARNHFSKEEFQQLWEENWLDNILYLWCRAVFLARLHCNI